MGKKKEEKVFNFSNKINWRNKSKHTLIEAKSQLLIILLASITMIEIENLHKSTIENRKLPEIKLMSFKTAIKNCNLCCAKNKTSFFVSLF